MERSFASRQLSYRQELAELSERLARCQGNYDAASKIFVNFMKAKHIEAHLIQELQSISNNSSHVSSLTVAQTNINIIDDHLYNITLRLVPPFVRSASIVKWYGHRQVYYILKGANMIGRLLSVPTFVQINKFDLGVKLEKISEFCLTPGEPLFDRGECEIIDLVESLIPTLTDIYP